MKWERSYNSILEWGGSLCKIYCNTYRRILNPILSFSLLLANCKEILKLDFMLYKKKLCGQIIRF